MHVKYETQMFHNNLIIYLKMHRLYRAHCHRPHSRSSENIEKLRADTNTNFFTFSIFIA
jgi:hypothetical protein